MLIRVLGEVSLLSGEDTVVALPGTRQPALLAALIARAGHVVSVDRLIDLLWTRPPENPAAAVHSAVFKLRTSLAKAGGREMLLTREHGYLLDLARGELDAEIFETLLSQAVDRAPAEAADTLRRRFGSGEDARTTVSVTRKWPVSRYCGSRSSTASQWRGTARPCSPRAGQTRPSP